MAPHLLGGTEYLDTRETAKRANISRSFLNKARLTGDGPPYAKIGAKVIYRWADVEAWLQARVRRSTSDQVAA